MLSTKSAVMDVLSAAHWVFDKLDTCSCVKALSCVRLMACKSVVSSALT